MIKRTLYFGNPAYLSMKLRQLVIKVPGDDGDLPDFDDNLTLMIQDAMTLLSRLSQ